jgi:hypothetical protein
MLKLTMGSSESMGGRRQLAELALRQRKMPASGDS